MNLETLAQIAETAANELMFPSFGDAIIPNAEHLPMRASRCAHRLGTLRAWLQVFIQEGYVLTKPGNATMGDVTDLQKFPPGDDPFDRPYPSPEYADPVKRQL